MGGFVWGAEGGRISASNSGLATAVQRVDTDTPVHAGCNGWPATRLSPPSILQLVFRAMDDVRHSHPARLKE